MITAIVSLILNSIAAYMNYREKKYKWAMLFSSCVGGSCIIILYYLK